LHTLESELLYLHNQSHSGDQSSTSARKLTRVETFSQALIGAEAVLSDKLHKSELYMEAIDRFLNLIPEAGLAKRAARTKARVMDGKGKMLLGSLLREAAGWIASTSKLYFSPPEVLERLRAEAFTIVVPTERPTCENIRDVKYPHAVPNGRPHHFEQRLFVSTHWCAPSSIFLRVPDDA